MLDATAPDLLDIITPPPTHRGYVGLAMARGIPTICQKPFGTGYADATAMVDLAARARVPLVVHENFRFEPWHREAHRFVVSGRLGTPHAVGFRMRPGDGQGARAYLDRQPYFQSMPRFLIVETAIHFIDTFRLPDGRGRRGDGEAAADEPGHRRRGCRTTCCSSSPAAPPGCSMRTGRTTTSPRIPGARSGRCGSRAAAACCAWTATPGCGGSPTTAPRWSTSTTPDPPTPSAAARARDLQRHVLDYLAHGAPLENAASDYLANLRVQEAAYVSHREGRRVALSGFVPPKGVESLPPV